MAELKVVEPTELSVDERMLMRAREHVEGVVAESLVAARKTAHEHLRQLGVVTFDLGVVFTFKDMDGTIERLTAALVAKKIDDLFK